MSRAFTREEVRNQFLDYLWIMIDEWARADRQNCHERLSGLVHSILSTIDGCAMALPAFKLVLDPHPDDKQYYVSNGSNWYEPDMDVTGTDYLHEMLYQYQP